MYFETVRDSVITLLQNSSLNASPDGYRVVGSQVQNKAAEQAEDQLRTVQVFYSNGNFPQSGGSDYLGTLHEITFDLQMTVAKGASVDLATINDPESSDAAIITALSNLQDAGVLADQLLDDLFSRIYNTVMAGQNRDLGLAAGKVASRWVDNFRKDEPLERGGLLVLTGRASLTCKVFEEVIIGEIPTAKTDIDTEIQIKDGRKISGVQV